MMPASRVTCDYCLGPVLGNGLSGRAWPDRPATRYCCFGCLSLGEQRPAATLPFPKRFNGPALRIGLALVVIAQSMILSLGIAIEGDASRDEKLLVYGGILFGTLIVFGLLGLSLIRAAWDELRAGFITIESLFLLTMAGAFAASLQSFVTGSGPVYFEVVSVVLVVYSVGKVIMARAKQSAIGGTMAWADSLATCRRVIQKEVIETPVTEIVPGDLVEVRPGELIPVDGVIETGTGFVSMAAMTGEPFAVVKRPGNPALAGCVSQDALFRIRATVAGTARQVDHLLAAVDDARSIPTAGQAMVDRISSRVFPLLILIAIGTFAYWTWKVDPQTGMFNAMSVLLVACPCALGLATPLVIWVTLARLAEWGFVVRTGDVVERLGAIDTVLFDKTGTLTEDRFTLADIATVDDPERPRPRWLGWMAAVQARSSHPMAKAFAELGVSTEHVEVTEVRTIPGQGVEATVEDDGRHQVRIGRPEWINAPEEEAEPLLSGLIEGVGHRIDCEADGRLVAVAVLRERLRESVPHACEHLAELGVSVGVLTGDTAKRSTITGINDVQAELLPDDKTAHVRNLRSKGRHVLMAGDGINDAGALAAANVGIALASGTDLATRAADVTLYHADLRVLPWAIALGRQAALVIRRNLKVAAAYNAIGVTLAMTGNLHPIVAALLMVGSSLFVIWSSSRVNVSAEWDCHDSVETSKQSATPYSVTIAHALALVLQGLILIALLGLPEEIGLPVFFGFTILGFGSAILWAKWKRLSHRADMVYGMLTLGNLGMIAGWWADAGFRPLQQGNCDCAEAIFNGVLKPWMWLGMWLGGTLAMAFLTRTPHGNRIHRWSMHTGGNLGMGLGMLSGGWLAAQISVESIRSAAVMGLVGMTLGMIVGMFAGTALTEQSIRRWKRIRRKLRVNP
ncbi:heavy metal translocating P-type ATPase [Zavarzinella formosa]|uniref:heavy metal translocating P-type ATPase n=1 Tax=Zavarzinella formosa TaxID=360055 RepID=UPI0002E4125F|nr:cation-translocating P-type ATPase [Zavarzinella formosa]